MTRAVLAAFKEQNQSRKRSTASRTPTREKPAKPAIACGGGVDSVTVIFFLIFAAETAAAAVATERG